MSSEIEVVELDLGTWTKPIPCMPPVAHSASCAAMYLSILEKSKKAVKVEWDAEGKAFALYLKVGEHDFSSEAFKRIPVEIATESNCDCGHRLKLGDYSILAMEDDFELKTGCFCESCRRLGKGRKGGFLATIRRMFSAIEMIKVGPTGLEVKKKTKQA